MTQDKKQKKRVVVSYKNLSPELQEEIKKQYPNGYTDRMLRIDKGPGDFFYAIMLETEDISYLVKVDVKVDEQVEEEASARDMITACEAVEGNKFGLYMLDKELAARAYTQASPLANA